MRPKAEWAIDSEPILARGITVKYLIRKLISFPKRRIVVALLETRCNFTRALPLYTERNELWTTIPLLLFSTVPFKAPTNLTGMATNSTSVFVKWDPVYLPTIRGILRGYTVHYKEDSSSVHPSILRNVSVDISVTNAQLVNLHKYTYYLIWVTAFTTRQGSQSSPLFVQTHEDGKSK